MNEWFQHKLSYRGLGPRLDVLWYIPVPVFVQYNPPRSANWAQNQAPCIRFAMCLIEPCCKPSTNCRKNDNPMSTVKGGGISPFSGCIIGAASRIQEWPDKYRRKATTTQLHKPSDIWWEAQQGSALLTLTVTSHPQKAAQRPNEVSARILGSHNFSPKVQTTPLPPNPTREQQEITKFQRFRTLNTSSLLGKVFFFSPLSF